MGIRDLNLVSYSSTFKCLEKKRYGLKQTERSLAEMFSIKADFPGGIVGFTEKLQI